MEGAGMVQKGPKEQHGGQRSYTAPILVDYGAVSKITQASGGNVGDSVSGMNMVPCL